MSMMDRIDKGITSIKFGWPFFIGMISLFGGNIILMFLNDGSIGSGVVAGISLLLWLGGMVYWFWINRHNAFLWASSVVAVGLGVLFGIFLF